MFSGRKIFFAAADWGLGHVTRSAPILNHLCHANQVIVGSSPETSGFYKTLFPSLPLVILPSYGVTYSSWLPAWLKVLVTWNRTGNRIRKEHTLVEAIIRKHGIDTIISDSRYGLFSRQCESILITHQLNMQVPVLGFFVNRVHRQMIDKFNRIWVPDFESTDDRLAGSLSDRFRLTMPVTYIGPQSALMMDGIPSPEVKSDVLILLSGPEPQRTLLEEKLCASLWVDEPNVTLVRGTLALPRKPLPPRFRVFDLCAGQELKALIEGARVVICRSGYSTLMDLWALKKVDFLLIPTPGQPEQEYLAGYWKKRWGAKVMKQRDVTEHRLKALLSRIR